MNRANRKAKLSKYRVTIKREVEYLAILEVEARNAEEAQETAESVASADAAYWVEGGVVSQVAKAKVLR